MTDERKVVWKDRWLSGGTPGSRFNVPVSYVTDFERSDGYSIAADLEPEDDE